MATAGSRAGSDAVTSPEYGTAMFVSAGTPSVTFLPKEGDVVMTEHAEGTFTLTGWNEDTYEQLVGEAKLTRAQISQDFEGDLVAKSTWESLMCYRDDGTARYVGFARMQGRLGDIGGSFVLLTDGVFDGEQAKTTWSVVEGSATDGLKGLHGTGSSAAPHGPNGTYSLDYEL
jgi:hypothetical protein